MTKIVSHIARKEKRYSMLRMFVLMLLIGLTSFHYTSANSFKELKETTELAESKEEFISRRVDLKTHPAQSRHYKVTTRQNLNSSCKEHFVPGTVTDNKIKLYIMFQQLIH